MAIVAANGRQWCSVAGLSIRLEEKGCVGAHTLPSPSSASPGGSAANSVPRPSGSSARHHPGGLWLALDAKPISPHLFHTREFCMLPGTRSGRHANRSGATRYHGHQDRLIRLARAPRPARWPFPGPLAGRAAGAASDARDTRNPILPARFKWTINAYMTWAID